MNHFLFQATKNEEGEWLDGERWANCGRIRISASEDADVEARLSPEGVGQFTGYQMCGSIWACPQCAAKIRAVRAEQIAQALRVWLGKGGRAVFVTPTMRHHKKMPLAESLGVISGAWRSAFQGRSRQHLLRMGYGGFIRAVDLTLGDEFGWHPHLHNLVLIHSQQTFDEEQDDRYRQELAKWGRKWDAWNERNADPFAQIGQLLEPEPERPERPPRQTMKEAGVQELPDEELQQGVEQYFRTEWNRYLVRKGYSQIAEEGLMVELVKDEAGIGMYLTKAGFELARSDKKQAKDGGLTPWQLLREARETGEVERIMQWKEYCETTKGRRAIEWSRGLKRRLLDIDEDDPTDTDEAIVRREVEAESVALIGPNLAALIGMQVGVRIAVTRAIERNRADGLRFCLEYELKKRVLAEQVMRPVEHGPPVAVWRIDIAEDVPRTGDNRRRGYWEARNKVRKWGRAQRKQAPE